MTLSDRDRRRREFREKFRVEQKSRPAPSNKPEENGLHEDFEEKAESKGSGAWLTTITYEPKSFIMAMLTEMMGDHDDLDMRHTVLDKPIEMVRGNFRPGYYTIYCTFLNGPSSDNPFEDTNHGGSGIPFGEDKPLVLFQLKNHKNQIVDSLTLPVDPMFNPMTRARVPGLDQFEGTDCNKANAIMRKQEKAFAYAVSSWLDPEENEKFLCGIYGVIVGNAWPMMNEIFDTKYGIGEALEPFSAPSQEPVTPKETHKPHSSESLAPELVAGIKDAYDVIADGFVNGDISGGIQAVKLSILHGVKNKLDDVKESTLAKVVGIAPPKLKELLHELEKLEFKTLYNEAAIDEAVHNTDLEIHEAVDRLVEALVDDNERASFEATTAMGRIAYEIATRVSESLQGDKRQVMEVLDVNIRGMGWLFASRYSDTPQFPELSAE